MITFTIRANLILKAFGYTATILVGAFIFAIITWATTQNQDMKTYAFWGGIFLGILKVLTDELKKREACPRNTRTSEAQSRRPPMRLYWLSTHLEHTWSVQQPLLTSM